MTEARDYISPSQIQTYLDCGMRYFWRYEKGVKIPPPISLVAGTSIDNAVAGNLRQKQKTGRDLPQDVLEGIFLEEFRARKEEAILGEDDPNALEVSGVKALRKYRRGLEPINAELVQPQLEMIFKSGMPLKTDGENSLVFRGIPDFVFGKKIYELKTKKRKTDLSEHFIQLASYLLLGSVNDVADSDLINVDVLLLTKSPEFVRVPLRFSDADFFYWRAVVSRALEGIRKGVYLPTQNRIVCNQKFCGFWNLCRNEFERR